MILLPAAPDGNIRGTQRVHARRFGRPEEIARSIVRLCSDEASYITGTTLTPDDGFTVTF